MTDMPATAAAHRAEMAARRLRRKLRRLPAFGRVAKPGEGAAVARRRRARAAENGMTVGRLYAGVGA